MEQANYYLAAIIAALVSLALSVATYLRTGDWKRTEAGKDVESSISGLRGRVGTLETRTEEHPDKIEDARTRLSVVEARIADLPTKADVSALKAEVHAMKSDMSVVRSSVTRIENHLLGAGGKR
ncbi:DUF2730 family protein [Polymorphobacter sp.]|uniref:DUF2730 family protein n=1 Tax=Polymorphobacter sp. TaxID=1909290 RepID=UPI003F727A06